MSSQGHVLPDEKSFDVVFFSVPSRTRGILPLAHFAFLLKMANFGRFEAFVATFYREHLCIICYVLT